MVTVMYSAHILKVIKDNYITKNMQVANFEVSYNELAELEAEAEELTQRIMDKAGESSNVTDKLIKEAEDEMTRERDFRRVVLADLQSTFRKAWIYSPVAGPRGRVGVADLFMLESGIFFAIELKTDIGKTTSIQELEIYKVKEAGGVALVTRPSTWKSDLYWIARHIELKDKPEKLGA